MSVGLSDLYGHELCEKIRALDTEIPIILISKSATVQDRVLGLELGADDYISEPFDYRELVARVRAIQRRRVKYASDATSSTSFQLADIEIFPNKLRTEVRGEMVELSPREVKILELFYLKKNEVVSRDCLIESCWGRHIMAESRTVDFHISKLRKRIERDSKNPKIIKTVHGVGYRYDESA